MSGFDNRLVLRKAEVVIGTEHDYAVVLHLYHRGLTTFEFVKIGIDT
jgi:hypothetical protein